MRWIGQITYDEVAYFREDVIIEAGNKLGIGTTSPGQKLHVVGSGIFEETGNTNVELKLRPYSSALNDTYAWNLIAADQNNNYDFFITNGNTEVFHINNKVQGNNNVGIGTSSPTEKLDITGNVKLNNSNGSKQFDIVLQSGGTEDVYIKAQRQYTSSLQFGTPSGVSGLVIKGQGVGAGNHVGIGTTSPASLLHVAGTVQVGVDDTGHDVVFYGATSGRHMTWNQAVDSLVLTDNAQVRLGSGSDMRLYHNATDSFIMNYTGHLNIRNYADDKDIVFQSDDGSGGVATYFYLDGSEAGGGYLFTRFPDNSLATFGDSHDLQIYHDSGNSHILNYTGDLNIVNYADDKDIIFQSDDGSGGTTAYLTLDGSLVRTEAAKDILFLDGIGARFGNSGDLSIYHDGSNSYIDQPGAGNLYIRNTQEDGLIYMQSNYNGSVSSFFYLHGAYSSNNPYTIFPDNSIAAFGNAADLRMKHDGSNSYIQQTGTGDLYVQQTVDNRDIVFQNDDGAGGVAVYFSLDGSLATHDGSATTNLYTVWPDLSNVTLGGGQDFSMKHDGTNTLLNNQTGNFVLRNSADDGDIIFQNDDGSGGLATYLTLDGSAGTVEVAKPMNLTDDLTITGGNGAQIAITSGNTAWDAGIDLDTGDPNGQWRIKAEGSDETFRITNVDQGGTAPLTIHPTTKTTTLGGPLTVGVDDTGHDVKFYGATSGRYLWWDESEDALKLRDNTTLKIGSGSDLQIKHDGSNSYISQYDGGNLYIQQNVNDADIIFQSDDGSGGVETYLIIDGSARTVNFSRHTFQPDGIEARFGTNNDLKIHHDGSNSYMTSATGNLYIDSGANDADIIFKGTDATADITALTLDMSDAGTAIFNHNISLPDSGQLNIGGSGDLSLTHDGGDGYIQNITGDLKITNLADDSDIIFQSDDGSGGVTEYLSLDGSALNIKVRQHMVFNDSKAAYFGSGADLSIYHSGGEGDFVNYTGNLRFIQAADNSDILFFCDDGAGGTTTYFSLDGSAATHDGSATTSMYTQWPDNSIISLGSAKDFNMYHNGTKTLLNNAYGNLEIRNSADNMDILFQCDDGAGGVATYFKLDGSIATHDGSSTLTMYTKWDDNSIISLGTGNDIRLYHNGTNSYLDNLNGDYYIRQKANDKDLILQCDDGSGGNTAYLTLDGSTTHSYFSAGNVGIGTTAPAGILQITKDASNAYDGTNDSGQSNIGASLTIQNPNTTVNSFAQVNMQVSANSNRAVGRIVTIAKGSASSDMAFVTENVGVRGEKMRITSAGNVGIGTTSPASKLHVAGTVQVGVNDTGHDVKFYGATSDRYMLWDESQDTLILADNTYLRVGNNNDMYFFHDGTNTKMRNLTGDLYIENHADDGDVIFQSDDGSGGLTPYLTLDGSASRTVANKEIHFLDNVLARFGTGNDMSIYHDATYSWIINDTGDLYIRQRADDKDIIFQADDGSGGVTEYFRLDGSSTEIRVSKQTQLSDNVKLALGNGEDLQIYHDGSHSYVAQRAIGNLYIQQNTADADLVLQCDDGSGGTTAYLTLDGSAGHTTVQKEMNFADSVEATFGTSNDLRVFHNGSHTYLSNQTGDLYIRNQADDKDIVFQADNGSGGNATYFSLDGSAATHDGSATTALTTNWPDKSRITLGAGSDLQIVHNGADSTITNTTGNFNIYQNTNDGDIRFYNDNGSGGTTEYFRLDGGLGYITVQKAIRFNDSVEAFFGTSDDLKIIHNGSHSYVSHVGTGDLYLQNTTDDGNIILRSDNGSGGVTPYITLDGGDVSTTVDTIKVLMPNLPTSDPSVAGQLYHVDGDLKISLG